MVTGKSAILIPQRAICSLKHRLRNTWQLGMHGSLKSMYLTFSYRLKTSLPPRDICTMILVRGEHRRFERNVFQLFFLFAPSHRGFCVENRRNGTLSHESRFTCDVVRTFLPDNWKLHRKRYEWYFVTKIVLTYCEIKLFYFWNSRLKVENLQKKTFEITWTIYSNCKR